MGNALHFTTKLNESKIEIDYGGALNIYSTSHGMREWLVIFEIIRNCDSMFQVLVWKISSARFFSLGNVRNVVDGMALPIEESAFPLSLANWQLIYGIVFTHSTTNWIYIFAESVWFVSYYHIVRGSVHRSQ